MLDDEYRYANARHYVSIPKSNKDKIKGKKNNMQKQSELIFKWGEKFSKLTNLYELFHFEKLDEKEFSDTCAVYLYSNGYFKNIEIFTIFDDKYDSVLQLKKKYEEAAYSVKVVSYRSLQEAHDKLYAGFFDLEKTIKRFKCEYQNYCDQQTKKLSTAAENIQYEYIHGDFYQNGNIVDNQDIVALVGNEMLKEEAKLIIIEAAAGMGKTSSSYEIFNYILQNHKQGSLTIPVLIELTKNRTARIFRHVIDDEIYRNFTGLNRDLVITEIKNGNIPLIIDGFDELISKQQKAEDDEDQGNAQTMLDTIAELLTNDSAARIVLTSRKSTIFTGDLFEKWRDDKIGGISVQRYEILTPTVDKWLNYQRMEILHRKRISLDSLENPVLLAYLKYADIDTIENLDGQQSIVDIYFTSLLSRERARQDLNLSVEEQKDIFTHLAKEFVNYGIIAEESSFIKDLFLEEILKNNIDDYMERYTRYETKPLDDEEFAMKLVRHALMDRIKPKSNKIGFINEFVFGTFIAEALIQKILNEDSDGLLDPQYISMATSAFAVEQIEKREKLYDTIKEIISLLDAKERLNIETTLLRKIAHNYNDEYFERFAFQDIDFCSNKFNNCTFSLCLFKKCRINISSFVNCNFINCNFYDVELEESINNENCTSYFSGCIGSEIFTDKAVVEIQKQEDENSKYKKIVLENFWNPGKPKADSRRSTSAIFRGTPSQNRHLMAVAIDTLMRDGYISFSNDYYQLNHDKMAEIRSILGR